eukprot:Platyproteum_vivax@DN4165_c0_g1_i1.p1
MKVVIIFISLFVASLAYLFDPDKCCCTTCKQAYPEDCGLVASMVNGTCANCDPQWRCMHGEKAKTLLETGADSQAKTKIQNDSVKEPVSADGGKGGRTERVL